MACDSITVKMSDPTGRAHRRIRLDEVGRSGPRGVTTPDSHSSLPGIFTKPLGSRCSRKPRINSTAPGRLFDLVVVFGVPPPKPHTALFPSSRPDVERRRVGKGDPKEY